MTALYNEIDPRAAEWLRELIAAGMLPPGHVDERSILDLEPEDLEGYTQFHAFAGIGTWPYALRRIGWGDDTPIWTGSPPCQPFSSAGQQKGKADERHLWPHFHDLIDSCRPPLLLGEQVASALAIGKAGTKSGADPVPEAEWSWLDHVLFDLENSHYASAATAFTACSVGAPHLRLRTYFGAVRLADSGDIEQRDRRGAGCESEAGHEPRPEPRGRGAAGGLGNANGARTSAGVSNPADGKEGHPEIHDNRGDRLLRSSAGRSSPHGVGHSRRPDEDHGGWEDVDWLFCRDAKWRPAQSSIPPLADGTPTDLGYLRDPCLPHVNATQEARVMRLKGYGNGIVLKQAEEFAEAFLSAWQLI